MKLGKQVKSPLALLLNVNDDFFLESFIVLLYIGATGDILYEVLMSHLRRIK